MWFLLGGVTLLVALAFQWRIRWHSAWDGERIRIDGMACRAKEIFLVPRLFTGLKVALDVPEHYRFELKHETALDRFFKWVGLSVERQFGASGFDPLVYVAADDAHLLDRFGASHALRTAAQHLFARRLTECRLRGVYCSSGKIWIDLRVTTIFFDKAEARAALERGASLLLPELQIVASELHAQPPTEQAITRDRFLIPSVVFVSISSALAIYGLLSLFRNAFDERFTLNTTQIWFIAFPLGTAILAVLVVSSQWVLARSARAHLVLLELLLVGSFGAYSTSYFAVRDINIDFDLSATQQVHAVIFIKSIEDGRSGRFGRRHSKIYLFDYWWEDPKQLKRIRVHRQLYEGSEEGDLLEFEKKAGFFGIPWVSLKGAKRRERVEP